LYNSFQVRIGDNLHFGEDSDEWRISFASSSSPNNAPIIGGVVGVVVELLLVMIAVIVRSLLFVCSTQKKLKETKDRVRSVVDYYQLPIPTAFQ